MGFFRQGILACILVFASFANAEYFSDYEQAAPIVPPAWELGASYLGRWSAGGYDHWLAATGDFRLNRHWDLPLSISSPLGNLGVEALLNLRWLPSGRLLKDGYEDWLQIGAGAITEKVPWDPSCTSCTDWRAGPAMDFAYGRDILPWEKSPLGFRLSIAAEWVVGNVLTRETSGLFGLPQTNLGNLIMSVQIGVFWLTMG